MLRALWVCLALALSGSAHADTWATFGFLSAHSEPGYNGFNPGLGIEHEIGKRATVVAGAYENSYSERSRYIGAGLVATTVHDVRLGIVAGVVDGYRDHYRYSEVCDPACHYENPSPQHVKVMLVPTASINRKWWGANVSIMPAIASGATVLSLQFKVRLP